MSAKLYPLELQRARRRLESFCTARNRAGNTTGDWCLNEEQGALIVRAGGRGAAVMRLCPCGAGWSLSVPGPGGGWRPYPARPEAPDIETVIAELEQAPLHIHW